MKYKNGIFIGKFYPLHFGHISTIKALALDCEQIYVLFFCNQENEKRLHKDSGYEYHIDDRIADCREIFKKEKAIRVLKLTVDDNRKFPENRDSILVEIKRLIKTKIDVQIFGAEEASFLAQYRYTDNYLTSSPYTVEDENGNPIILHSTLIRKNYDHYKKYIPHIIRKRIDGP